MIEKCMDLIKLSTQRADEYYRAITTWATSRRNHGSIEALLRLGLSYRSALNKALLCLRGLKRSAPVEQEIAKTKEYENMISVDLELLKSIKE